MPVKQALNAAHVPLRTARNFAEVFQKYAPMAIRAAMAAATQPIIGIFMIATPTARHAAVAVVANTPNEVEAMPENVAEAVPPVTNDSTSAPSPFRALKIPTVANLTRPIVARPILPIKPNDIMLLVVSVPFISARLTAADLIQPAQLSLTIKSSPFHTAVSNGASWATGTSAEVSTPHQSEKSPVAWNMEIFRSSNRWFTRACRSA